jgi:hypothetical protein
MGRVGARLWLDLLLYTTFSAYIIDQPLNSLKVSTSKDYNNVNQANTLIRGVSYVSYHRRNGRGNLETPQG